MYRYVLKRLFDIVLSALGMVILSPVYLVLAILVRCKLGKPVLFSQSRPGKNEKIFKMYKFRTMTNDRGEDGKLLPDEVRLTRFGKLLRSTSLDELPELWNIFIGNMSFVGPRPLAVSYLQYYTEEERHRHDVRPGLTGLAQVNGRNSLSWEDKFKLDLQYVNSISFLGDVKILFQTAMKVVKRDGIGQGEEAPVSLSVERRD
ncbi:MAG: sugar transferase [Clostridiales bacterium]|nr:sugar transferase [Clostridiales bacterium]